jgi:uncharacterized membrane protein
VTGIALLKLVHVLLVVFAVGTNLSFPIWVRLAERDPWNLAFTLRTVRFIDRRLTIPAYGLVAITGVALALAQGVALTEPWIALAIGLFVVIIAIGILLYSPASQRRLVAAERGGAADPAYREERRRAMALDVAVTSVVVLILGLMVFKPSIFP